MAHDAEVQKTAALVAVSEVMTMKEAIKHADIMTTSFGGGRLRSSFLLYLNIRASTTNLTGTILVLVVGTRSPYYGAM